MTPDQWIDFEEIDAKIKNLEREINDAKKMVSELKPNVAGQPRDTTT